ncbi:MAG: hypothetical protein KKD21_10375, partial [Proteobacteria bacterium]|nr:hypothetical protein [Pseudomonadota bacterium]
REIQAFAEDIEKTNKKNQQKIDTAQLEFSTQIKVAMMTRLGIPLVRIAQRLNIHRETISKYAQKNQGLFNNIHQDFKSGIAIPDMARKYGASQPLVWSVVLQEKTDLERFKALNWGLRAWDNWYFNDVDHRFGDPWPGRIPAQPVTHTLFYFTKKNNLVLDPMAGGGVVADTCLAFNRECRSFDLLDRMNMIEFNYETYLEKIYKILFEEELESWMDTSDDWPKIKNYKMFKDWFEIICSDMIWDYGTGDIEHEKF